MKKWEYKEVYCTINFRVMDGLDDGKDLKGTTAEWLNTFGEKGWELISARPRNDEHNYFIFKRPKE